MSLFEWAAYCTPDYMENWDMWVGVGEALAVCTRGTVQSLYLGCYNISYIFSLKDVEAVSQTTPKLQFIATPYTDP